MRGAVLAVGCALTACALTACAPGHAPRLDSPGDRVGIVGRPLTFALQAADPDGEALTFGARGLPVGATFDAEARPPVFRWVPLPSDAGATGARAHPVIFIAQDPGGARSEARIVLTILPSAEAPSITGPHAFVLAPGEPFVAVLPVRADALVQPRFERVGGPADLALEAVPGGLRISWPGAANAPAEPAIVDFAIAISDAAPPSGDALRTTEIFHLLRDRPPEF